MTRRPSTSGPSVTGRYAMTLSGPMTYTNRLSRSVPMASSRTSTAAGIAARLDADKQRSARRTAPGRERARRRCPEARAGRGNRRRGQRARAGCRGRSQPGLLARGLRPASGPAERAPGGSAARPGRRPRAEAGLLRDGRRAVRSPLRRPGTSARRLRTRRRSGRARRASSAACLPGPLDTRLPSVTMAWPTRPAIGAVTRVNSRFNSAARSAASKPGPGPSASSAARARDRALRSEMAFSLTSRSARSRSAAVRVDVACARCSSAPRRSTSAWNGRGSISKRTSFWRTMAPSVKCTAETARHAGPDVDVMDGFEPAGELVALGDRPDTAWAAVT